MIRTEMVKVERVYCDICGQDTGYTGDQQFATVEPHLCRECDGKYGSSIRQFKSLEIAPVVKCIMDAARKKEWKND